MIVKDFRASQVIAPDFTFVRCVELTMGKLLAALSNAFNEAGLAATLALLHEAAEQEDCKIGRGDTVVVPMEFQLWNKNTADNLFDALHHTKSQQTADSFLIERPAEQHPDDNRRKPEDFNNIDLPVIAFRAVEEEVRKLTCTFKISVIVSGGNSHLDLGQICLQKLDDYLPTKRFSNLPNDKTDREEFVARQRHRMFEARGTYCGAIIVGSGIARLAEYWLDPLFQRFNDDDKVDRNVRVKAHADALANSVSNGLEVQDHRDLFPNFGLSVDVSGRASATEIAHISDKVVPEATYFHWAGASIASMVAAACLANVQHIRMLSDLINKLDFIAGMTSTEPKLLLPLKPFEARAHFRQWRSNDSYLYDCLEDLMGAPPDIKAWFEGSCYFDVLIPFQKKGAAKIIALAKDD